MVSHNELDKTNLLEIGELDGFMYLVYDSLIKKIFGVSLIIEQVQKEKFVNNLFILFNSEEVKFFKEIYCNCKKLKTMFLRRVRNTQNNYYKHNR